MPVAPLKRCAYPLCPELVEWGKCEAHRVAYNREIDHYRGSARSRGYDTLWERVRLRALKRDNYLCQGPDCLGSNRMTPAKHVDHVVPFQGKDDPLRLDLDNLQSLCKPCHSRKTAKEDGGFGNKKVKTIKDYTQPPEKKQWWRKKVTNAGTEEKAPGN